MFAGPPRPSGGFDRIRKAHGGEKGSACGEWEQKGWLAGDFPGCRDVSAISRRTVREARRRTGVPLRQPAGMKAQTVIEKCEPITHLFDAVHQLWDHRRTQRALATVIFFIYLAGLLGIEANRQGMLPPWLEHITPISHFQAIHLAFTLILGMEVMELILTISGSLSKSLGKQFEVMALILLRDAFKELSNLPEPVSLTGGIGPVVHIASAGLGALIIFICLGFYYQLRTHQNYITNPEEQMRYVMSKKLISLVLFLLFVGIAVRDLILFVQTGNDADFFETIYTILIFADIALVLISQRFMPDFHAVFRNSGFVIGTLIMRLSLSAPWPWNIAASIFAAVFVLALTWATTYFGPSRLRKPLPR